MQTIIDRTLHLLSRGEPLILATVISHEGSTPRDTGTRFIIGSGGKPFGTIGGGLVEAQVIELAPEVLKKRTPVIVDYDMSQSHLSANTMVCGGKMSVLLEYFEPNETSMLLFRALQSVYMQRRESILVVNLDRSSEGAGEITHAVIQGGKTVFSSLKAPLSAPTLAAELKSELRGRRAIFQTIDNLDCWVEAIQFPKKLILFGAGHVARPTADLGVKTGFQTTVVDDRQELLTDENFQKPIELIGIEEYGACLQNIPVDKDTYIVILTRGHAFDKAVLGQALKSAAGYVGMIGSRRKRNTIYSALLEEGFTQSELGQVHCPIGIKIGADTPAEIAVSIIAELIQFRSSAG